MFTCYGIYLLLFKQECLQPKDNLNYRYFHKRVLYLCIIASHLKKKKKLFLSVQFSHDMGTPLLPVLIITPKGNINLNDYITY